MGWLLKGSRGVPRQYTEKVNMRKYQDVLKDRLKEIVGKDVSLTGSSNCMRITLTGGREYFGTVSEVGSDFFTMKVSYTGGGKETIAVSLKEVSSFLLKD